MQWLSNDLKLSCLHMFGLTSSKLDHHEGHSRPFAARKFYCSLMLSSLHVGQVGDAGESAATVSTACILRHLPCIALLTSLYHQFPSFLGGIPHSKRFFGHLRYSIRDQWEWSHHWPHLTSSLRSCTSCSCNLGCIC